MTSACRTSRFAERDERDDEEADPLTEHVALLAAERPDPVERVVIRHGDEKRDDRGRDVVELENPDGERVDGEVDEVADGADGAELEELHPVAAGAKRGVDPRAERGRRGCPASSAATAPSGRG